MKRLGKIKAWICFSPWIFIYIIDFLINLQTRTEWECGFLNTAIIIFCLIYIVLLNIPHRNQNPSFLFLLTAAIFHHIVRSDTKIILTFLFVWFTSVTETEIQTIVFFYLFQALNINVIEYLRFTNCYGKANKKRKSWHSETRLDTDCLLVSQ